MQPCFQWVAAAGLPIALLDAPPVNSGFRAVVLDMESKPVRLQIVPVREETALPVLLTIDEAAQLLRTSRKAIYALIERRQIPGVTRLGRRVLVRSDELLEFLRQKSECHR